MHQLSLFGAIRPLPYFYIVTAILGLLFTFIAPDSHRSALGDLLFWLSQTLLPLTFILGVHILLYRIPGFDRIPDLAKLLLSGLTGVIAFVPLALWIDASFDNQAIPPGLTNYLLESLDEIGAVGPPVIIGWVALNAPWLLGYRFTGQHATESQVTVSVASKPTDALTSDNPPIPDFLPDDLNQVIYMKAELHYLLVVTTSGQSLELFNLKDGAEALSSVAGLMPHRSWWVNRLFISKLVRDGRQGRLLLKNGEEVPVSRRRLTDVREQLSELQPG